jgi:hypothetical protein
MEKNMINTLLLVIYVVALLATFAADYREKSSKRQGRS